MRFHGLRRRSVQEGEVGGVDFEFIDPDRRPRRFFRRRTGFFLWSVPGWFRLLPGRRHEGQEIDFPFPVLSDHEFWRFEGYPGEVYLSCKRLRRGDLGLEGRKPQDLLAARIIQGDLVQGQFPSQIDGRGFPFRHDKPYAHFQIEQGR